MKVNGSTLSRRTTSFVTDVNCRLRDLLRGKYAEDHPDAIISEEDMEKKEEDYVQMEKEEDGTDNK